MKFGAVPLVSVVHGKPLAQFDRSSTDNMVEARVVRRVSSKDFDANRPLLDLIGRTFQRLPDDEL